MLDRLARPFVSRPWSWWAMQIVGIILAIGGQMMFSVSSLAGWLTTGLGISLVFFGQYVETLRNRKGWNGADRRPGD